MERRGWPILWGGGHSMRGLRWLGDRSRRSWELDFTRHSERLASVSGFISSSFSVGRKNRTLNNISTGKFRPGGTLAGFDETGTRCVTEEYNVRP